MDWISHLPFFFFFFYFCLAFNFADYPPFSLPFLAEMVSFLRFSDRWWRTYQRGTLYGWNLCLLAKLPATFQARKKITWVPLKGASLKGAQERSLHLGRGMNHKRGKKGYIVWPYPAWDFCFLFWLHQVFNTEDLVISGRAHSTQASRTRVPTNKCNPGS